VLTQKGEDHLEHPELIERLAQAMNAHDVEGMTACVHEDYKSEQPLHPEWNFTGRDQMRKNWTGIFEEVPDLKADLIRSTVSGDELWTEWRMHGTREDGSPFEYPGVAVWGIRGDRIAWGRLYFGVVEPREPGSQTP
jgi:ketosteroid isomerase-like protein